MSLQLKVSDLVIVNDEDLRPSFWRLAKISATMPGT